MNGAGIAEKFDLYTDLNSNLSDTEIYDLMNDKYNEVLDDRDWEFLRKTHTGTSSTSVSYIALPTDFKQIAALYGRDSSVRIPIVLVGSPKREYEVIKFADRYNYEDMDGYCYIDSVNSRLYFTKQPETAETVIFDYIYIPSAIVSNTSPIFRAAFHNVIVHGMAIDQFIIDQSDKARSYYSENQKKWQDIMDKMRIEDARIKENI